MTGCARSLPRRGGGAILIDMTVTVELIHEGAMNLLRDMESLGLLHVNSKQPKSKARNSASAPHDGGDAAGGCPICAKYYDPATESPPYNAETMAAIAEGDAMLRGEIPAVWHESLDDLDKMLGL